MDTALVNIGDYPSSPDFASLVRYGSLLQQQQACGRMLIYYFNEAGTVIQSDQDFAIQIPIELLKRCPRIIGVCSANTSAKALRGALHSGVFTHIAARAELVRALLALISNICNPQSAERLLKRRSALYVLCLNQL